MRTLASVIVLSRWKEHIGFVLPLTLLGVLLAQRIAGVELGFKVLALIAANFFSVAFAFMINNVEDAEDDLLLAGKAKRNPVSSNQISLESAYFVSILTAAVALTIFVYLGRPVVWFGISLLALSFFYSAKPVRLKSWPVVDIISHSLMLGGLLILSAFFVYSNEWRSILYLTLAVCLFSAYGQIYNQLRDFGADKKVGLKNTTIILGKKKSLYLAYAILLLAILLVSLSVKNGLFPYWLALVALVGIYISKRFVKGVDVGGTKAVDFTGMLQTPASMTMNIVVFTWFAVSLLSSLL